MSTLAIIGVTVLAWLLLGWWTFRVGVNAMPVENWDHFWTAVVLSLFMPPLVLVLAFASRLQKRGTPQEVALRIGGKTKATRLRESKERVAQLERELEIH